MKQSLSLNFFGTFQAILDGNTVTDFKTAKVRALLVYLALEAGKPHQRSDLARLLWPDMPEKMALRNLTQTLVRVRQAIQDDEGDSSYLLLTRRYVQFNKGRGFFLDVAEFERIVTATVGKTETIQPDSSAAIADLTYAVTLYRGEFLPGFSLADSGEFEEWMLLKRECYQHLALEALSTLAAHHLQEGNTDKAQSYAQRQLELDPWQERAHRQLMRCLAQSGQRPAALAQYKRCREILWQELGVQPEAATTELYELIRTGELYSERPVRPWAISEEMPPKEAPAAAENHNMPSAAPNQKEHDAPQPLTHNIPHQLTSIIGRATYIDEISYLLAEAVYPLITLVGSGGAGKTRLALAIAERLIEISSQPTVHDYAQDFDLHLRHGIWYVPLAGVGQPENDAPHNHPHENSQIAQALLNVLGLSIAGTQSSQIQLANYLANKEMVLILDSFEHLISEVEVLLMLLREAPQVRILVTSRETLNIGGEYVVRLGGLLVPETADLPDAAQSPCVELFLDRVYEFSREFTLDPTTLAAIIRICKLVDGLPLGIELAATWVQHFSCAEIADAIQESLDFLVAKQRDRASRHQSLRAVFDYSWHLLSASEQATLAQLAVFRGAFSRVAALAVAQAQLTDLIALVDKSLLQQLSVGRYVMHGLLRHFVAEKMYTALPAAPSTCAADPNDRDVDPYRMVHARHAAYYISFAGEKAPGLYSRSPRQAMAELAHEMDNIRQACHWAVAHDELDLIDAHLPALACTFVQQGLWHEGQALMEKIIEKATKSMDGLRQEKYTVFVQQSSRAPRQTRWRHLLPKALAEQARFLTFHIQFNAAIACAHQAITLAQCIGDQDSEAAGFLFAGTAHRALGLNREAKPLLEKGLAAIQAVSPYHAPTPGRGMNGVHGFLLSTLSAVCIKLSEEDQAARYAQQAEQVFRTAGDLWGEGRALMDLAIAYHQARRYAVAYTYLLRVIKIFQDVGSPADESTAQDQICRTLTYLGRFDEAKEHGERALWLGQQLGDQFFTYQAHHALAYVYYEQGHYVAAREHGQMALASAQRTGNQAAQAVCHTMMGYIFTQIQLYDEAVAAHHEALRFYQAGGREPQVTVALGHLAFTLLKQGKLAEAKIHVEKILPYLMNTGLDQSIAPLRTSFTCYRVLHACHDPRAATLLRTTYDFLQAQATWIHDPMLRTSFLQNVPGHREILAESSHPVIEAVPRK